MAPRPFQHGYGLIKFIRCFTLPLRGRGASRPLGWASWPSGSPEETRSSSDSGLAWNAVSARAFLMFAATCEVMKG